MKINRKLKKLKIKENKNQKKNKKWKMILKKEL